MKISLLRKRAAIVLLLLVFAASLYARGAPKGPHRPRTIWAAAHHSHSHTHDWSRRPIEPGAETMMTDNTGQTEETTVSPVVVGVAVYLGIAVIQTLILLPILGI